MPERWTRARTLWTGWLKPFALIMVALGVVRSAVMDCAGVPTGSMKPTILEGDRVLVNKLAYGVRIPFTNRWVERWDRPERGEIVVFVSPADGKRLVKRIAGVPGDTVELRGNALIINGRAIEYGPAGPGADGGLSAEERRAGRLAHELLDGHAHAVLCTPGAPAARDFGPVVVPRGRYFMLGDNRDLSADSRIFGFVARSRIVGRVGAVAFSLDRENCWLPRWSRTMKAID